MDEEFLELVEMMKNIGPQVWEIYLRQVQVEVFQSSAFVVVSIVVSIAGAILLRKGLALWEEDYYNNYEAYTIIGAMLLVVGIVLLLASAGDLVSRLMNPEYYAIKLLVEAVK